MAEAAPENENIVQLSQDVKAATEFWQLETPELWQQNLYLLKNSEWTDCTFIVGSGETKTFHCHKLLLSKASPVFGAMLYGPMSHEQEIKIPDIEPDIFDTLVKFMYTGQLEEQSVDAAVELCLAAEKYMLHTLKKDCEEKLIASISIENVISILELAKMVNSTKLEEKCLKIMLHGTDQLLKSSALLEASQETLLYIVQKDELFLDSELELISACISWAENQATKNQATKNQATKNQLENETENLRNALGPVFIYLNFLSLTHDEFMSGPYTSNVLTEKEKLMIIGLIHKMSTAEADEYKKMKEANSSRFGSPYYDVPALSEDLNNQIKLPLAEKLPAGFSKKFTKRTKKTCNIPAFQIGYSSLQGDSYSHLKNDTAFLKLEVDCDVLLTGLCVANKDFTGGTVTLHEIGESKRIIANFDESSVQVAKGSKDNNTQQILFHTPIFLYGNKKYALFFTTKCGNDDRGGYGVQEFRSSNLFLIDSILPCYNNLIKAIVYKKV